MPKQFNGEMKSFQQVVLGKLDIYVQKNQIEPYSTPYTKLKRIKDLNIRSKATKLLEENIAVHLCDLELGNGFSDMTPYSMRPRQGGR